MKALLLDLDDTLLDYSSGAEQCWAQACGAGAGALDQTVLLAELAQARRAFWSDPERHRRERTNMLRAWTAIVAHALERCGAADPRRAAAVAEDFATRRRAVMTLFPEAREVLGHSGREGCRWRSSPTATRASSGPRSSVTSWRRSSTRS